MAVRRPNPERLRAVAESLSFRLSDDDLRFFLKSMEGALDGYDTVDALPDYLPKVKYPRAPGYRPSDKENPFNAWYVKAEIRGATEGKLAGKTVAIKDNVAIAGVQMMNGASTLEGYMPDVDATVVGRLLDAGATILGKAQCEYFCLSGGSHTSAQGSVRNPYNPEHSSAGSSSGCAALIANGDVDLAIGGDQGGSIRTPASYCGIVGMKPTWGLVPYTGAMPIELTIDHLGPMSRTVEDNARMLEVIAGFDGLDPRQSALAKADRYTDALGKNCNGLKIGVLKEGFEHDNSEADVDASVKDAADKFRKLGATVEDVSVPMHRLGPAIWVVVAFEGATQQMMKDNGPWVQLEGTLPDEFGRCTLRLEVASGRTARHREANDADRRIHDSGRARSVLCQGTKPHPAT
ncbi:Asp-tRNA(Asn)/Glu-tRNA(Gln) amidotransferase A subunit family amidase [Bradyrhizobium sp. GM24.11]